MKNVLFVNICDQSHHFFEDNVRFSLRYCFVFFLILAASLFKINAVRADTINSVDMLASSSEIPPIDSAAWRISSLPYKSSRPKEPNAQHEKYIWFRFSLENEQPLSLYIAHYYFNVAVFLNGAEIGGSIAPVHKQAVGLVYPIFVNTSGEWLAHGKNIFHIRLNFAVPTTLMSEIHVGNAELLETLWKEKTFQQSAASLSSVIICILLAVFTFGLWLKRKQDRPYLIFASLAASWCITMLYVFLPFSPIEHSIWISLAFLGIDFAFLSLFFYINRVLNLGLAKLEKLLFYKSLLSTILVLFIDIYDIQLLFLVVYTLNIFGLVFVLYKSCLKFFLKNNREAAWVILSFALLIAILGHDLYIFIESAIEGGIIKSITYFQIGFPAILLILFSNLIKRFVDALNESEELNLQLEDRVRKSAEALELSYKENREIELLNAANQEKQRIYQDLHDDVGSKLVSIIHSKEKNNSQDIARSALLSLRESVANSKNIRSNLSELMKSILDEAEVRCLSAGLVFEKRTDAFGEIEFDSTINRHISRIVREAITNIIKHSQAQTVILSFEKLESGLRISVEDDGLGINPDADFGSGIENMRFRAQSIGAEIDWRLPEVSGDKAKGCLLELKCSWTK